MTLASPRDRQISLWQSRQIVAILGRERNLSAAFASIVCEVWHRAHAIRTVSCSRIAW